MKLKNLLLQSVTACLCLAATSAATQEPPRATCVDDAMLVFDGSSSMLEVEPGFEKSRIEDAREAARKAIPEIAPFRQTGLVVYGPGRRGSCSNIRIHFPPIPNAAPLLIEAIDQVKPLGSTPLSGAVLKAAKTLRYKEKPGVIVLLTDGQETCGGTPCYTAERIAEEGVGLIVHVIGFRLKPISVGWKSKEVLAAAARNVDVRCFAEKTGGQYVSTKTVDELTAALRETLGCPLIG